METKTYWEQVLWLGPDNWGAIQLVEETENVRRQQEKANQPKPTTSKARRR